MDTDVTQLKAQVISVQSQQDAQDKYFETQLDLIDNRLNSIEKQLEIICDMISTMENDFSELQRGDLEQEL